MRRLILPLLLVLLTAATPATPAADSAPKRFAVHPPPLSRALFPALEAARLHALRLLLRGRSLHIDTSAGVAVHVLVFKGPPDRKKQGGRGGAGGEEEEALLPPLVLLHGVCSTAHDYAPLVRRLRGRCQCVIVLDLPGHGQSPVPPGDPDLEKLVTAAVEAVQGALARLDTEQEQEGKGKKEGGAQQQQRVVLFGNSLGGLVGCRVALAMPGRVAGLCLASPAGAPMTPEDLEEIRALFQLDSHQKGLDFLRRVAAFPDRLPFGIDHLMAWCCRARVSSGAIAHIMSKAEGRHMLTRRDLRRLRHVPVLLIWGKHERVFNDRHKAFFVQNLSGRRSGGGAELRTEEEMGHVPFLDDADRTVALLEAFVRGRCL